jgi:hypothetical protein
MQALIQTSHHCTHFLLLTTPYSLLTLLTDPYSHYPPPPLLAASFAPALTPQHCTSYT